MLGAAFFLLNGSFWQVDRASLHSLFEWIPVLLCVIVIPVITMRLIAEEKSSGTLEMLVTLPVKDWEVIIGKYIGAYGLVLTLIASTLIYPFVMFVWPWKLGNIDVGTLKAGYFGLVLLAGAAVSIGLMFSTVTRSQVIAFFITISVLGVLIYMNRVGDMMNIPTLGTVLNFFSFTKHMSAFSRGVIETQSVIYFLSVTIFGLVTSFYSLEARKWT
jgi:ABC-2 type transport system permease protein